MGPINLVLSVLTTELCSLQPIAFQKTAAPSLCPKCRKSVAEDRIPVSNAQERVAAGGKMRIS